jgi:hypothetical protein
MILQRQTERYVKLFGDQSFWLTSVQHRFSTLTTIQIIIPDPTILHICFSCYGVSPASLKGWNS